MHISEAVEFCDGIFSFAVRNFYSVISSHASCVGDSLTWTLDHWTKPADSDV